jgi:hypothetical protein
VQLGTGSDAPGADIMAPLLGKEPDGTGRILGHTN